MQRRRGHSSQDRNTRMFTAHHRRAAAGRAHPQLCRIACWRTTPWSGGVCQSRPAAPGSRGCRRDCACRPLLKHRRMSFHVYPSCVCGVCHRHSAGAQFGSPSFSSAGVASTAKGTQRGVSSCRFCHTPAFCWMQKLCRMIAVSMARPTRASQLAPRKSIVTPSRRNRLTMKPHVCATELQWANANKQRQPHLFDEHARA